jgi:gliding motility-associated-like protein
MYKKDTVSPIDSITYTFPYESQFVIKLRLADTLTQSKICESTFERTVESIYPEVQNLLTRNNDDVNDYFEIPGLRQESNYKLVIFNRWGRKVYEKENYDNTFKSSDLPQGTYFYNLSPQNGPGRAYKGWLELSNTK